MIQDQSGHAAVAASNTKKKVLVLGTTQEVIDKLSEVAKLYDDAFIGEPKPRIILEKFCKLFTAEEIFDMMRSKMQSKRKGVNHE